MSIANKLQEHIDPASGRRLVSVSFDDAGTPRKLVIPFELLADDLLEFLAMAAPLYPDEIQNKAGFQKFQKLILASQEQP